MSDTPRTDEDLWSFPGPMKVAGGFKVYVRAQTSRELERELNAANDRIKRLEQEVQELKVRNEYAWQKNRKLNERIRHLIKLGLETTRPEHMDQWQEEEEL